MEDAELWPEVARGSRPRLEELTSDAHGLADLVSL
jgi:hypothetical protein